MIGFGCVTTSEREFRAGAARAIEQAAEPNSLLMRRHDEELVARPCNAMLDRAAEHRGIEALVLLAEDMSLETDGFLSRVRELLAADGDVALLAETGGGGSEEAGVTCGGLVVLSEWAVHELRFDEGLAVPFDCAVADLCHQATARGRRVVSAPLGATRPTLLRRRGDRDRLVRGAVAVRRKWPYGSITSRS